jgi:hypothetical protein
VTDLSNVYSLLETDRHCFLERAYRSAVFTIPSLLPRAGRGRDQLPQNYQALGARGVNNLSSKLKLTLFPTDLPFFRLTVDPFAARQLVQGMDSKGAAETRAEIEKNLALIEETARLEFHTSGLSVAVTELIRHLVVTGNGLIMLDPDRGPQFVDLRKFVVERDPEGNLLKVVVKQEIADTVLESLFEQVPFEQAAAGSPKKQHWLYTGACRDANGKYEFWQQVDSAEVPGSRRTYAADVLPIIPFRFTPISGENYGGSYVEEYDGDLLVLEALSRAITEAALAAAKLLILVRPGSTTRISTIANAPNGAIRQGHADDVTTMSLEKQADLATAERRIAVIEQRLSYAFLLFSSVQRQAERVTAEEVRLAAQELEDALGGVYTALAETVQKPIVDWLLAQLNRRPDIPKLPKQVKPVVATGLEAISRGHKAMRLLQWGQGMQSLFPPEEIVATVRSEVVGREMAVALNLDPDAFLRTAEEIEQIRTTQSNQALVEKLGPNAINAAASQPQA